MNKLLNRANLGNVVVQGDGLLYPRKAKVFIGNTKGGYEKGDILDANAVMDVASDIIGIAPEDLDTIKELASAIGDDPHFVDTVNNKIDTVSSNVTAVDEKVDAVDTKVDAVDEKVEANIDNIDSISERVDDLSDTVSDIQDEVSSAKEDTEDSELVIAAAFNDLNEAGFVAAAAIADLSKKIEALTARVSALEAA